MLKDDFLITAAAFPPVIVGHFRSMSKTSRSRADGGWRLAREVGTRIVRCVYGGVQIMCSVMPELQQATMPSYFLQSFIT